MDLLAMAETPLRRRLHHLVLHLDGGRGLPLERYRALGRELGHLTWLDLHGAEPCARVDLVELVGGFEAELVTLSSVARQPPVLIEAMRGLRARRSGDLTLVLQLDGLQRRQDHLHGAGAWDRCWQVFDALRPLPGLRLEFRTCLGADNCGEVLALAQYLRQQGAQGQTVTLALEGDCHQGPPSPEALQDLEGPLFEILDRYTPQDGRLLTRLRRNFQRLRWTHALRTLREGRQVVPCLAGLSHAVVRANGDVAACELLPALGNLGERGWGEIWGGAGLEKQRAYIGAGGCHCTDERALHDSILLRPMSLPGLLAPAD